jgi:hypothetical protein
MTYNLTTFKNKNVKARHLSKRVLGMESLESRELLSVNPLGYDASEYVQTASAAQDFQTEAATGIITEDGSAAKYTSVKFNISSTDLENLVSGGHLTDDETYTLQYREATTGTWAAVGGGSPVTVVFVSGGTTNQTNISLTGLSAGTTYELRLVDLTTNSNLGDDVLPTTTLNTNNPDSAYDIGTISTPATSTAKLVKTSYSPGSSSDAELELTLSGIPEGYADNDIVVTGTFGPNGTGGTITSPVVASTGTAGEFTITITGLTDNDIVKITNINIASGEATLFANVQFVATDGPSVATPTTNSTSSASGVTSSAVTLTWTKPNQAQSTATGNPLVKADPVKYSKTDQASDYKITIDDGAGGTKVYYSLGKTTLTITDFLVQSTEYSYKVEVKMNPKSNSDTLVKDATSGYTVVTSGLFETASSSALADNMAVGRPTDVKTTPADTSVKITWKAPVNYIGAYTITITDADQLVTPANTITKSIAAGAKLEYTIPVGTTQGSEQLAAGKRYRVVITPTSGNNDGGNGLKSTPTYFVASKAQTDPSADVPAASQPANTVADSDFFTITAPAGIYDVVEVKLGAGKTIPANVDGYWIKVTDTQPASDAPTSVADAITKSYVYVTKEQITAGVNVYAKGLAAVNLKVYAANSAGLESAGAGYTPSPTVAPTPSSNYTASATSATDIAGTVTGNKITVTWKTSADAVKSDNGWTTDTYATRYDVYVSRGTSGQWVLVKSLTGLNASTPAANLTAELTDLEYATDYYFAVVGIYSDSTIGTANTVTALQAVIANKVTTGSAPTVSASNILTAKKVTDVKINAVGQVEFTLEANTASGTKVLPEQYYVVLRDANKAVIAKGFVGGTATAGTLPLKLFDLGESNTGFDLTAKAKYTLEVYGVVGTTVSTAKATGSLSVADYPAATIKAGKPTVNGVSITVTDKSVAAGKFYYVEYTKVADAKSKPDWSTATVEKLAAGNVAAGGGTAYPLGTKLDPSTQYYVRIVTADVDVAISGGKWVPGASTSSWIGSKAVVFGKEVKVKTAAVPLATVGKPAIGFDATNFDMTLKTVGQTMLSGKGADAIFTTGTPPISGATFAYKLLVSIDSKVDKVTGKLLGSKEIELKLSSPAAVGDDIIIETYTPKSGSPVAGGQYKLEYALTGDDGIFKELGITATNAANLKNLNFQLLTEVTYGTDSFESVTKPGKVALPKWFV